MIYFTSDLHFYHDNIIKYTNRPFRNAEQMDSALIRNWNNTVTPSDEIYILGDLTLKGAEHANTVLRQLNGKKYLIRGNHEHYLEQKEFDHSLFVWVKDYYTLHYKNAAFVLFHYPIAEWDGFYRGAYHLHGHQHNRAEYNFNNRANKLLRYDVGVDANQMKPVSIETILAFFSEA